MEPESEETGREDKMSPFALHTRVQKIEALIFGAGAMGIIIRFLIKHFNGGI